MEIEIWHIAIASIIPCIVYIYWIWHAEKIEREPSSYVLLLFIYGAFGATFFALILESIISYIADFYLSSFTLFAILAVIVAPIVEEATKGYGVMKMKNSSEFDEPEDGGIYGASIGLGFAFFENFLYFAIAWREYIIEQDPSAKSAAFISLILLIIVRSLSASFLHGAASGLFGISVGREKFLGDMTWRNGFQTAVALHMGFNAIALFSARFASDIPLISVLLLILLVFFGINAFRRLHDEITSLEYAYLQRQSTKNFIKKTQKQIHYNVSYKTGRY